MDFWLLDVKSLVNVNGNDVCFDYINTYSSMGVQCVAPEKCRLRHTTSCDDCKNNIGKYKDKCFMNYDKIIV